MKRILLIAILLSFVPSLWAAKTETISLKTSLMPGPDMNVTVITPEGYDKDKKFPTVYLLNGYTGNNGDWTNLIRPNLGEYADLYGMVMVMPDGRDTWYWDSPANPQIKMESFIIDELVPYIDANYPTLPSADKRAITGLSMGGHGAFWLAMRHSDVFGSAGSMSGGVNILPFTNRWKIIELLGSYEDKPEEWASHTVINLVPSLQPGQLNLIFDCGTDDFFAQVNEDLHQALLDAKIPHDYTSRPGNHSRAYWRNSILYHLVFFNEIFNQ